jgi:hypothetical protein
LPIEGNSPGFIVEYEMFEFSYERDW